MGSWKGPEELRPLVRSMRGLKPHPRNPRVGDVQAIYESLHRFGQQKPILVDRERQVVAGNHTLKAAKQLGWKQIALIRTDLTEPEEIERYLIADNRTSDLATYDNAELRALLEEQRRLDGTGYNDDDLAMLRAAVAPPAVASPDTAAMRIVLRYPEETYRQIVARLDAVMAEHNLQSFSDAVEHELWNT